jgi:hypothetical protein
MSARRFFRSVIPLIVAALTSPVAAFAAKQQVSASTFKATGPTGAVYGRSDGVFQEANTKAPYVIENGESAGPVGVGYRETFAYGVDDGISQLDQAGLLTCAGNTTTVPCLATFGSGVKLMWAPVVTATLPLDMDATSLDIAGDQTDNDGTEIFGGLGGASGRPFIVGDDEDFYFCATVAIEDVSGTDEFRIGFRMVEPMNAVFGAYDTYASIGPNAGAIYITTELAGAGETDTDTTNTTTDAAAGVKYCVDVSEVGAVTYSLNGAAPTVTAALTLTDGIAVVPMIHFLHAADLAGEVDLTLWEVGYR